MKAVFHLKPIEKHNFDLSIALIIQNLLIKTCKEKSSNKLIYYFAIHINYSAKIISLTKYSIFLTSLSLNCENIYFEENFIIKNNAFLEKTFLLH